MARASGQDRSDVAHRWAQWRHHQAQIDPGRLVFIDETWTKTNIAPLRGWAPCGTRLIGKMLYGRWHTMTFIAALRHDQIAAPWLLDGPINRKTYEVYVEKILVPTLKPDDLVTMDNLASHEGRTVCQIIRQAGANPHGSSPGSAGEAVGV